MYELGYFTGSSIRVFSNVVDRLTGQPETIRCYPSASGTFTMFWMSNAPVQFELVVEVGCVDVYIPNDMLDRRHETLNFLDAVIRELSW